MATAIDPASISLAVGAAALPLRGFVPTSVWGRRDGAVILEGSPERAKKLLAESGLRRSTPPTLLVADGDKRADMVRAAEAIRASLAAADFAVAVQPESIETAHTLLRAGEHVLALVEERAEAGDPHFLLYPLSATEGAVKGPRASNFSFYRNPRLDDLLIRASQLSFKPERQKLYMRAQAMLAEDLPWIPIYVRLHWAVARPEVRNLRLHASGNHRLDRVALEAPPAAAVPAVDPQGIGQCPAGLGTGPHGRTTRDFEDFRLAGDVRCPGAGPRSDPQRRPMLSISDTATEMVNWVFPEHAGAPGQIHGGRMMQWIATCGTIAASRVARGNVLLGAMDDIDFLHPVKVGEVAVLRAQVEYVGRCSLEVGVQVFAESPRTGERALTLSSHLVFVKVDGAVRPVPVPQGIVPRGADEEVLARGGPGAAQPSAPALRPAGRAGGRDGRRRHRGLALALRVVSLGPARGHVVRPGHVRREALDGHRRGGRHPLDAL